MSLFVKLFSYFIIIIVVAFFLFKMKLNINKNDNETENLCFDYKIFSKIFFICAVILSLILIMFISFASNVESSIKTIVIILGVLFNLMFYGLGYICYVTFVCVSKDKVIYNLGFGTKELLFSEITKVENNNLGDVMLYKNDKKVLLIPKDFAFALPEIQSEKSPEKQGFIMRVSKVYRNLMLVCCIVFMLLFVLSYVYSVYIGLLFFGIMLIVSIVEFINEIKLKIMVTNQEIKKVSLFNKKTILIENIKNVEIKEIDNAKWLYIYSENGLEMKINTLYTNSYLLVEVLKTKITS